LDVEYYRDLETWVKGRSRSLKLVPFESLSTFIKDNDDDDDDDAWVQFPIRLL